MRKLIAIVLILASVWLVAEAPLLGGRRGGGGGARPSGMGPGGGRPAGGSAVQSYGAAGGRAATPIVGPANRSSAAGGGSYTTRGGSSIDYKGAAVGGTTPGGVQGGRYVGGVQVNTPGGREVTKVGSGGAVVGPGGNAVGGRHGAAVASGPHGSVGTRYQGGAAIGPQGGVAAGSRTGVATGAGGTAVRGTAVGGAAVGGSRGMVANGGYGAAAGRTTVAAGYRGTYYRSATAVRTQGVSVRRAVVSYPCFRPGWYTQHRGAWFAAGWTAGTVWRAATWPVCATYCAITVAPVYYSFGENIVYQDDGVYFDGEKAYSAEQFAELAINLADAGRDAKVMKDEEWLPLGVFALVQGDEQTSNHIFQLAVNKQGIIRGNYYDAVTDSTQEVYGSVNPKTQRAAWSVGDRKTPVYEAGIANLTEDETTMLVHYGKDRSQQFTLFRVSEPETK